MAQEVYLDNVAKDLDVAKIEANLAHTKSQAGRGSFPYLTNPTGYGSGQSQRGSAPPFSMNNAPNPGYFPPGSRSGAPSNREIPILHDVAPATSHTDVGTSPTTPVIVNKHSMTTREKSCVRKPKIIHTPEGIILSQQKYIQDLLCKAEGVILY
uniref:Uncharacterized protein n=1 Tax=Cannabis sativa TaxID=3483 RepID=A0A803PRG2_CANSA